jgi:hypothetical protein
LSFRISAYFRSGGAPLLEAVFEAMGADWALATGRS